VDEAQRLAVFPKRIIRHQLPPRSRMRVHRTDTTLRPLARRLRVRGSDLAAIAVLVAELIHVGRRALPLHPSHRVQCSPRDSVRSAGRGAFALRARGLRELKAVRVSSSRGYRARRRRVGWGGVGGRLSDGYLHCCLPNNRLVRIAARRRRFVPVHAGLATVHDLCD